MLLSGQKENEKSRHQHGPQLFLHHVLTVKEKQQLYNELSTDCYVPLPVTGCISATAVCVSVLI